MNEVLTLDQEARSILREVLKEKDLAIEELTRQIIQYQSQLTNFEQMFQSFQKQEALGMDQHNIEALMNAGFIKNEDSQFHILIDITQIIHQKLDLVKLDSKIQIIKEVNNANLSLSKQFNDAYELLRNQNNILLKQISEKDKEYESIINSLKDTINKNKEEHEKAIAELQSKIEKIEEEKEIIQMETDQIVEEKNGLNHFMSELRDKHQQKLKQCEQHITKIAELTLKNESLMKQKTELTAQSAIQKKSNEQIIEQQKQIKQKYQELEYQYNKFVTSSQDNDSFIKQRQLESINNKKQIKLLQQKIKSLEDQCQALKTENQKYINQIKKFEGYQVLPSVQNMAQSQLKVFASSQKQKLKQKRKGKKMIRIGY